MLLEYEEDPFKKDLFHNQVRKNSKMATCKVLDLVFKLNESTLILDKILSNTVFPGIVSEEI